MTLPSFLPPARPSMSTLSREHMPLDHAISVSAKLGQPRGTTRLQPMRGFEESYTDIVDFIDYATRRIWDDQNIGYIANIYHPDSNVIAESSEYGVERVVQVSGQTIHQFPDGQLIADEVIWGGNDEVGFHTSHRYVSSGRHLGESRFGPPSGKRVTSWGIANCIVRENMIIEEFLLYNDISVITKMGLDASALADEWANVTPPSAEFAAWAERVPRLAQTALIDVPAPPSDRFDPDATVRYALHQIWNKRDLSAVDRLYAHTARLHATSDREAQGHVDIHEYYLQMFAAFPDLSTTVDDLYWMGNDAEGYSVAVRWSMVGTHTGFALYGPPTGKPVFLWGMSHLYIVNGVVREEYSLFNEFNLLLQLRRA